MPDRDKPSLFQGLRNLIGNLFQGGKATTPEQPVNVQAPPAQQVVAQEEAKPDSNVAQVNAEKERELRELDEAWAKRTVEDAKRGRTNPPPEGEYFSAKNKILRKYKSINPTTAVNTATPTATPTPTATTTPTTPATTNVEVPKVNPVTNVETPQANAVAGGASALGGLSGGTAMPATEGQPTDVAVAEANTGTIPASVVKPVATTPVTYPGTQTAVTPQASGDLPLNFSFEEDLTAKGKQASGDVQSQALMDMAQQAIQKGDYGGAEAMLRRPLTNQDFFAGPGMRESRTAWGDPIFTGEGQLFPMAVLDARQKAQAQVRNMAIEDDVLNMTIPTVNVAGLRENYSRDFVADSEAFMRDGIKRYGSAGNAIKAMKKSGEWAKHMSKWKATAEAINTTGKMATEFLTKAKEGMQNGDTFASPEALASATMFLNGLEEFGQGNIGPERLAQLQDMFLVTESWNKYLQENKEKVRPMESVPDFEALKALDTEENKAAYKAAIQELPVGKRPGYEDWLVTTKVAEVSKQQAISTLIEPFLRSNPTAFEQFRKMYDGMKDEEIINALGDSVAQMYGRQLTTTTISRKPTASMRVTTGGGGGDKAQAGFYGSTVANIDATKKFIEANQQAMKNDTKSVDKVLEEGFGGSWRPRSNDPYARVATPGVVFKGDITPERYFEYYQPTEGSGSGTTSGQFGKIKGDEYAALGVKPNEVPKKVKVVGAEMAFAIQDKDGNFNIVTKDRIKKFGMPLDAIPVVIEQVLLYNRFVESGSEDDNEDVAEIREILERKGDKTKDGRPTAVKAQRIFEATPQSIKHLDDMASNRTYEEGGIPPVKQGKVEVNVESEDFD